MYIDIKHISKTFTKLPALNDINFGVAQGSLTALLGPSGSGKTTLLRILAGLETADAGEVYIDGHSVNQVKPQDRGIGFVFQNYALFRYLTVYDNIAFGLKTQHWPADKINARVHDLLKLTQLDDLTNRYPDQLSGGQKQRVAFVRAIAPNPKVLFLDEPFAALDSQIRQELRAWLKHVIHQMGITSLFVTHDHEEAIETADEIVVMDHGQVQQIGTPEEIYNAPTCRFVAGFIGHANLLADVKLAGFDLPKEAFQVQIRPEQVHIYKANEQHTLNGVSQEARVEAITFQGATTNVQLNLEGTCLFASRPALKEALEVGETVQIVIPQLVLFKDKTSQILKNHLPVLLQSYAQ